MCRPQMEELSVGLMDAPDLRRPSEGRELIQEFTGSLRCHGTAGLALLSYLLFTLFALCVSSFFHMFCWCQLDFFAS